nr:MAG TPA: hypothetical protein [Caudoviricetes sp.]
MSAKVYCILAVETVSLRQGFGEGRSVKKAGLRSEKSLMGKVPV